MRFIASYHGWHSCGLIRHHSAAAQSVAVHAAKTRLSPISGRIIGMAVKLHPGHIFVNGVIEQFTIVPAGVCEDVS